MTPDAELGTAYRAAVRMRCWNGKVVRYTQTMYPEAPDGLQVFTPPGAGRCSGELLSLLLTKGLPTSTGEQGTGGERSTAQAVAADGGSGGAFGAGLAITVALAAALALRDRGRARLETAAGAQPSATGYGVGEAVALGVGVGVGLGEGDGEGDGDGEGCGRSCRMGPSSGARSRHVRGQDDPVN